MQKFTVMKLCYFIVAECFEYVEPLLCFWNCSEIKLKSLAQSKKENPRSSPVYPPISANKDDLAYASLLSRIETVVPKYNVIWESDMFFTG